MAEPRAALGVEFIAENGGGRWGEVQEADGAKLVSVTTLSPFFRQARPCSHQFGKHLP